MLLPKVYLKLLAELSYDLSEIERFDDCDETEEDAGDYEETSVVDLQDGCIDSKPERQSVSNQKGSTDLFLAVVGEVTDEEK